MNAVEFFVEGALYRCYRTSRLSTGEESYIVAGVGSVTIKRDTGVTVAVAPVIHGGARMLETFAPLIHEAAPLPGCA